jgi:hypothetical protein
MDAVAVACSSSVSMVSILPLFVFRRHPEPSAKDPRILHDVTGANIAHQPRTFVWAPPSGCATANAEVLQLRFRMTTKNKQRQPFITRCFLQTKRVDAEASTL